MRDQPMMLPGLSDIHESYRLQIEELQRKVQQLELAKTQRDQAWRIIGRIETFFTDSHYMEKQEWEDD